MAPRIVILSMARAESYQPHGTEVCISITDPKAPPARLSPAFRAVLRLGFTDIAEPSPLAWHVLFTAEHARAILDFIADWGNADRIVIHCMAGLSRSPAVGMGICDLQGWSLVGREAEYPLCNTWVRSELVRIGRERKDKK
jgi:predicted protein tyrosine phosphatase